MSGVQLDTKSMNQSMHKLWLDLTTSFDLLIDEPVRSVPSSILLSPVVGR
jgi:hypothetical protein